jgi:hypothetical protein
MIIEQKITDIKLKLNIIEEYNMRGKTAKLLRNVARTNPYGVENMDGDEKTLYGKSKLDAGSIVIAPGFRMTYRYLKKFYKRGMFTTADLRNELQAGILRKVKAEMTVSDIPVS